MTPLRPICRRKRWNIHHDKHHQAYVTNGNNAIKGTEFEGKSLEEIVKGSFGKNAAVFNNAGQHYNHLHFWNWMKPNGGGSKLPGRLEKKINEDLGGLEKFKTDFAAAGVGQFGSGWCWLQVKNGKLEISKTAQRREPAGAWRDPDPRLRRLGAFLLHRLSQPPSGLPEGVCRSSGELGICRRAVRQGLMLPIESFRAGRSDGSTRILRFRRLHAALRLRNDSDRHFKGGGIGCRPLRLRSGLTLERVNRAWAVHECAWVMAAIPFASRSRRD